MNPILAAYRTIGISGMALSAWRKIRRPRLKAYDVSASTIRGGRGIEIGGPSGLFSSILPLYSLAAEVDNANYATETLWGSGSTTHIREATNLYGLGAYDFVLSCHMLEHTANPIKALHEWHRVLRPRGLLVLVVPDKERTFDHRRPVTTLGHVLDDYRNNTGEDDQTHIPEVLELHDLKRDPYAGSREAFEARCKDNLKHRGVHHHVFGIRLVQGMLDSTGYRVRSLERVRPFHIIAVAETR